VCGGRGPCKDCRVTDVHDGGSYKYEMSPIIMLMDRPVTAWKTFKRTVFWKKNKERKDNIKVNLRCCKIASFSVSSIGISVFLLLEC
jgi:hypothetical protein